MNKIIAEVLPLNKDELIMAVLEYRMEKGEALTYAQAQALLEERDNNEKHYAWENGFTDGKEYESDWNIASSCGLPLPAKPTSPYWESTQVAECGMPQLVTT